MVVFKRLKKTGYKVRCIGRNMRYMHIHIQSVLGHIQSVLVSLGVVYWLIYVRKCEPSNFTSRNRKMPPEYPIHPYLNFAHFSSDRPSGHRVIKFRNIFECDGMK